MSPRDLIEGEDEDDDVGDENHISSRINSDRPSAKWPSHNLSNSFHEIRKNTINVQK